ncbi:DEAD/DEAH box helicase [Scopulibacillus cellulosilyticus]|uniref:DEAD/DEAH box helicase n=1 Tax=Scopulibacillus cellulosilyticus TaxID=2665665 RepID=A0ABW2Q0A3_9BACL
MDEKRNELIFDDVLKSLDKGRSPIIITERIAHIEKLKCKFQGFVKNLIVLTGGMTAKQERNELNKLKTIPNDQERLLIATGKYIGEGFDDSRLDTLFLTLPISWKGILSQYVGRLHRLNDNKQVVQVYDYVDHREPILQKMYEKRLKGYRSLGYKLLTETTNENEQLRLF